MLRIGRVEGGTNAGWRIVHDQYRTDWTCPSCDARNKYYWVTCANCSERRPPEEED